MSAFICSAFLLQFHAHSCKTELFWLCEWFFSWFDLEHEFSWQKFINDEQFRSDALHSEFQKFIICSCISKSVWITTSCFQSADWWILTNNLYNFQHLLSNTSFWMIASTEFLLQCLQHLFSFNYDDISSFVIVCYDWIEWKLNDNQNHFSNLNLYNSLLLTASDLLC